MAAGYFDFEFDRPDRCYQSGDTVRGRLKLQTDDTVTANKVTLTAAWKTHGKGNTSTGDYASMDLYQGALQAGQTYEFPFDFVIPDSPWTYRGTLINVVHLVKARIHVPWAFDPQSETEFEVHPSEITSPLPSPAPLDSESTAGLILGTVIGLAFILGGIPFLFMFGCGLIPMGLGGFLLFMTYRNRLAERKLGKVDLQVDPHSQTPGETVTFTLAFTPRSRVTIDRILVTLEGQEQAVSGSGTNKTTHSHKLFEQELLLAESLELAPGTPYRAIQQLQIPESQAYSIDLDDNKIAWAARVRLDIPKWPDWERTVPLQLLPKPTHSLAPKSPQGSPDTETLEIEQEQELWSKDSDAFQTSPDREPPPVTSPEMTQSPPTPYPAPSFPTLSSMPDSKLLSLISAIAAAPRFGDERSQLVAGMRNKPFYVTIEVDRSAYNYGIYDDESYRNGRTLIGTLSGTETKVAVQLPESENESASSMTSGDSWMGQARPVRWDDLYDRLELRSVQ